MLTYGAEAKSFDVDAPVGASIDSIALLKSQSSPEKLSEIHGGAETH
jgi:hypothetical protein